MTGSCRGNKFLLCFLSMVVSSMAMFEGFSIWKSLWILWSLLLTFCFSFFFFFFLSCRPFCFSLCVLLFKVIGVHVWEVTCPVADIFIFSCFHWFPQLFNLSSMISGSFKLRDKGITIIFDMEHIFSWSDCYQLRGLPFQEFLDWQYVMLRNFLPVSSVNFT